jgi:hypothetical protein
MTKLLAALIALTLASGAFAAASCPAYPKADWMGETEARTRIEGMGYQIKKFKVSGNCYEIYGHDKAGRKAEVYFDAKSLAIVKTGD